MIITKNKMETSDENKELSNEKSSNTVDSGRDNEHGTQENISPTFEKSQFGNFSSFTSENPQIQYQNARDYAQALHLWLWQYRMFSAFSVFHSHMISAMTLPSNTPNTLVNGRQQTTPNQTHRPSRSGNNSGQPNATISQGTMHQYKVPLLWRRIAAETLDFILLFYAKILVTLAILRQMGYMNEDFIAMEAQLPYISEISELDYDKMFTLTSELIALEVLNRLCITLVETLCLRKGYAGSIGGATPGKKIMRLRVVSFDEVRDLSNGNILVIGAKNPGLMNALIRSMIKNFSMAFFFPASFTAFFFRFNRCAYDILAHTIVVEV